MNSKASLEVSKLNAVQKIWKVFSLTGRLIYSYQGKLHLLSQQLYHVTWSAGVPRCMMLIDKEDCYLIDPQFYFRKVQLRFPRKHIYEGRADITHCCTLLDGELITETETETQVKRTIYLIYDMMAFNESSVTELPFHHRLRLIEEEVIRPRNFERDFLSTCINPYHHYGLEQFEVRRKDFYLLSAASTLIKDITPSRPHSADGLIFQVGVDGSSLLYLQEHGNKKLIEGCRVMFKDATDLLLYSGRIIECSWNSHEDAWSFVQIQTDKSNPDDISVYEEAKRNIEGILTEDTLLDEIDKVAGLPVYSDWANRHSGTFRNVWKRQ
uniref:mRNA guanylyltransferase n=1 Tax=Solanum lycopersicum TaxID=4081 RepID=A0A3Q7I3X0_SOLLC